MTDSNENRLEDGADVILEVVDCPSDIENSIGLSDYNLMLCAADSPPQAADDEVSATATNDSCVQRLRRLTVDLYKAKRHEKQLKKKWEKITRLLHRANRKKVENEKLIDLYKSVIAQQLSHKTGTR